MRYISKIIDNDGESIEWSFLPKRGGLIVTVKDTETGELVDFAGTDALKIGEDCYGFHPRGIFVRQTTKALSLYRYIKEVKNDACGESDFVYYLQANQMIIQRNGAEPRASSLDIYDLYRSNIKLLGPCGSIVTYKVSGECINVNLYEWLKLLCRQAKLNLMSYRSVRFVGLSDRNRSARLPTVTFEHTTEAERFFIKMYMLDVLGRIL